MSLLPHYKTGEGCPPAYGNCQCICHRHPGAMHVMACCHPEPNTSRIGILRSENEDEAILGKLLNEVNPMDVGPKP